MVTVTPSGLAQIPVVSEKETMLRPWDMGKLLELYEACRHNLTDRHGGDSSKGREQPRPGVSLVAIVDKEQDRDAHDASKSTEERHTEEDVSKGIPSFHVQKSRAKEGPGVG
jgi:hypothetical protein